ncbi:unnamed protein product [Darwinula stevensoni]|uniref:Fibronectin type-III domain-containing protein n=1 Tax=Darwinula stevensoni TaxID=69355 RepID=A0A7R8X9P7_9CRUS|nr:unnamed protein product [Darwinula stevensoni]CAG0890837.1 unnamed protein product [Darwinula stevensoni]
MENLRKELMNILEAARRCQDNVSGISETIVERIMAFKSCIDQFLNILLRHNMGKPPPWMNTSPFQPANLHQWLKKIEAEAMNFKQFVDIFKKAEIKLGKFSSSLPRNGSGAVLFFLYASIHSKDLFIDSLNNFLTKVQDIRYLPPHESLTTLSQSNDRYQWQMKSSDGTTIKVYWTKPAIGESFIKEFCIWFRASRDQPEKWKWIKAASSPARIHGLPVGETYSFKISAVSRLGCGPCSPTVHFDFHITQPRAENLDQRSPGKPIGNPECNDSRISVVAFPKQENRATFAELLRQSGTCILQDKPSLYQIQTEELYRDEKSRTVKQMLPFNLVENRKEKVLILLGATGAGKSTLVNAIVNHFYGVVWEDPFRLVLISDTEDAGLSQSQSQTSWITAYTLPWQQGCRASYHLTIVDTPGFGDTKGLVGDKSIMSQLQKFFSERQPKGLDHVDGIGLVLQASAGRLTPTEKYIFDSVLSTFGKDREHNVKVNQFKEETEEEEKEKERRKPTSDSTYHRIRSTLVTGEETSGSYKDPSRRLREKGSRNQEEDKLQKEEQEGETQKEILKQRLFHAFAETPNLQLNFDDLWRTLKISPAALHKIIDEDDRFFLSDQIFSLDTGFEEAAQAI